MGVVGEGLHVLEALVDGDGAVGVAFGSLERGVVLGGGLVLPVVVDVHVAPPVLGEAALREHVDRVADVLLRHRAGEAVPAVPAHRRRERDLVAHFETQRARRRALRVGGRERDHVAAARRHGAAQDARRLVEHGAGGQVLGLQRHRTFARDGEPPHDGMSGAHAEHLRAVDARRGGRRRGEDAQLLAAKRHGHGTRPVLHREVGVGPVGVVEVVAVVCRRDEQLHQLRVHEVGMDMYRIALPLENRRLGHRPSIGLHDEADARVAVLAGEHLGVNAHVRVERDRLARHVVDCNGLGVRAHAARELLRADLQAAALDGLVPARGLPAAHHFLDRKLVQPHAPVGVCGPDEKRGDCRNRHGLPIRYFFRFHVYTSLCSGTVPVFEKRPHDTTSRRRIQWERHRHQVLFARAKHVFCARNRRERQFVVYLLP